MRRWQGLSGLFLAGTLLGPLALAPVALAGAAGSEPWTLVRPEAICSHVEFLASDLLEGRAAASRGYDIAAAYVAAQFRQSGLKNAGAAESFYQPVPLLEATPVLPGSSVELVVESGTHSFEYGTHYLPSADFTSASSTLSAPLTFAGYAIEAPELNYNDFAPIDLQGRIAVIFSGAPAKFPHSQRAYYSSANTKFQSLIEHGAVGVVIVDSAQNARLFPWERTVAMSWAPQMRWLDADGKPHNAFEQLKLRFRFNHEAAGQLFEGAPHSFQEVLAVAEAGEPQAFELPGLLTLSATTGLRRTESMNVIASLPGTDPRLKNEYVVVTAHLDHLGRGAAVNGDSTYNGAHDNALGIGILLEMARALNASDTKPRRSIVFAAVTAEEKGLLGSDYFAQHPPMFPAPTPSESTSPESTSSGSTPAQNGRSVSTSGAIVADINIDMPLLFAPTLDFVALGEEHSSLGALARAAAANQGYRLSPDPAPEQVGFVRSDQFSFIRQGIPSIVLMGGYKPRDKRTDLAQIRRDFLEHNYHQPSDDLALPMDFATAADLARINLRIALDAANATARPRWKSGDFFEAEFGRKSGGKSAQPGN